MRILFVEDEIGMAKIVSDSLEFRGYAVMHCTDGKEAFDSFKNQKPDLVVLDVMLPELDGFNLAVKIREMDRQIPIIFLTARTQTADVLKGFEMGANDYIKKPFSIDELIVRINFQLKLHNAQIEKKYAIGDYFFDVKNRMLNINGVQKSLSYRESELLKKLLEHKNAVLKRKDILDELWENENFFTGRSLDVFISRLRSYLKEDPKISIVNVRGAGYMLIVALTTKNLA